MKKCTQCKVYIKDDTEICPLCRCVVEQDETGENTYPDIMKKNRTILLLIRIYLFLAIVAEGILIYVNYVTFDDSYWSVIPAGILLYIYVTLRYAVSYTRSGYMMKLLISFLLAIGILLVIDRVMGNLGWASDFVLPSLLLLLDVVVLFMVLINRRAWYSYLTFEIVLVLIALVPFVAARLQYIARPLLSDIAFLGAAALFLGTLLIGGPASVDELKRRFHI